MDPYTIHLAARYCIDKGLVDASDVPDVGVAVFSDSDLDDLKTGLRLCFADLRRLFGRAVDEDFLARELGLPRDGIDALVALSGIRFE